MESYALVENNWFENIRGYADAIDFDYELNRPSIIRGNTIVGSEDDGIDLGFASAVIEGNRLVDCADKAISLEGPSTPLVYNNVIMNTNTAVAVKGHLPAGVDPQHNCFLRDGGFMRMKKIQAREEAPRGVTNCVIWDTPVPVATDPKSILKIRYSDLQTVPVYTDETNFSLEPLFSQYRNGETYVHYGDRP